MNTAVGGKEGARLVSATGAGSLLGVVADPEPVRLAFSGPVPRDRRWLHEQARHPGRSEGHRGQLTEATYPVGRRCAPA